MENRSIAGIPNNQQAVSGGQSGQTPVTPAPAATPTQPLSSTPTDYSIPVPSRPQGSPLNRPSPQEGGNPIQPKPATSIATPSKKDDKLDLSMINTSTWTLAGGSIIGMALGGLISLITNDGAFLGYGFAVGLFGGYGLGYFLEKNKGR